jgi:hypothetical protein
MSVKKTEDSLKNFSMEQEAEAYNLSKTSNPNVENGANNDDDDSSCPNKRTHFYEFKEYETVKRLIENIPVNIKVLRDKERSFEQFLFICDSYQEQPHLIDPFLMDIFDKLIGLVKDCIAANPSPTNDEIINESFKYMYSLCKMRGYKKIVQYLPHEIGDFEPVLNLLARQDLKDVETWHTRYMLLLWLSIVCMVPFDLQRFDANKPNESDETNTTNTILSRFLNVCTVNYSFISIKKYVQSKNF